MTIEAFLSTLLLFLVTEAAVIGQIIIRKADKHAK